MIVNDLYHRLGSVVLSGKLFLTRILKIIIMIIFLDKEKTTPKLIFNNPRSNILPGSAPGPLKLIFLT